MADKRYGLGRIADHDERSRNFAFEARSAVPLQTVKWEHDAPVLDQGSIGMCTGAAVTQWLNNKIIRFKRGGRLYTVADALHLYSAATKLDRFPGYYPPLDTGSTGLAACKAATKAGMLGGYRWAFSFNSVLAALQHGPVMTGTFWTDDMFTPDANGFIRATGEVAGGHEYVVIGCNLEHEYVTILNSWGPRWGQIGEAKLPFADYQNLLAQRGEVTIPQLPVHTPNLASTVPTDGCKVHLLGKIGTTLLARGQRKVMVWDDKAMGELVRRGYIEVLQVIPVVTATE